ncbi:MAG: acetylglutamate kinase, partial [Sphaerochaetaceae bacterium]
MKREIEKAKVLIEALPYIRRFAGSIVVIKYGGNAMSDPAIKQSTIKDIAMMKMIGMRPVVIH